MTYSSLVNDLIEKNPAQAKSNKPRKQDLVKRKTQYLAKKEESSKLQNNLNKILTPIAQDLLATVIKLAKKQGTIFVKSNFDNKTYKITLRVQKINR